jgi:hypothetical protein
MLLGHKVLQERTSSKSILYIDGVGSSQVWGHGVAWMVLWLLVLLVWSGDVLQEVKSPKAFLSCFPPSFQVAV